MTESGERALPPKYRMARNVRKGYQIKDADTGEWLTVELAMHITAPIQVSSFTFSDGSESSAHPRRKIMSRRRLPE